MRKVFGIGFHRTGTTSFQTALETLGYRVVGMRPTEWDAYEREDYDLLRETAEEFDAFRDMPWPLLYRFLYSEYPDARFVLTWRDPESWARSCAGNYKHREHRMFPKIYGFRQFAGNEEMAIEVYNRHIEDVRDFFVDKPGRFLEHDFIADPSWEALCTFLGQDRPDRPFPHANKRPRTIWQKGAHHVLRRLAPKRYKAWVRDRR